ncbi:hypothetical protein [Streptomyces hebeiensis]
MKSLLWLVLATALVANVATSVFMTGVPQLVANLVSGLVTIGAGVGLYLTRGTRAAS